MDAAPPHRAINFEAKAAMPPPLPVLQEIRRYGWPVARIDPFCDCHLNDDYRALIADGFLRDIRNLPIEVQLQAAAKGLIPDLPALVSSDQSGKLR